MRKAIVGMDWGVLIAAPLLALAAVVMGVGAFVFYVVFKPVEFVVCLATDWRWTLRRGRNCGA